MANIAGGSVVWNLDIDNAKFNSGLKKASSDVKTASKDIEKNIKGGADRSAESFANAMSTIGKAAVVGFAIVATAVAGTVTKSVQAFAEFEQLVGGVDTLFKGSSQTIQDYAADAYKTAGLSANQYMSTITSFSASLLQGLGGDTEKAAKIANLAVTDMADNANKMGTGIEMIQNAYQGFAKDNFMMLDNLKLGYGGTAGEMARLINESGVMGTAFEATAENVKDVPFDQMILAINKVQTELGITGTTAKEASGTISGSFSSMKSSWENLLTGFSNPDADVGALFDQFKESAMIFADNAIPAVKQALESIVTIVSDLWLEFIKANPILGTIITLLTAVSAVIALLLIPAMIKYIVLQALAGYQALIAGAKMMAGWLMALGPIGLIIAAVGAVAALIIMNWETVKGWLSGFWNWLKGIFAAGLDWIKSHWDLIATILFGPIGFAVSMIIKHFDKIKEVVQNVWNWITGIFGKIGDIGTSVVKGAVNSVIGFAENTINGFIRLINSALGAINKIPGVNIGTIGELSIPRLAEGGIVPATSGGRLAVIGEGGEDEAVIPLSKLRDMNIGGSGGGDVRVELNMSGIMARSRTDLRDIAVDMIEAVNEGLRAKNLPQLGNGKILEVSSNG